MSSQRLSLLSCSLVLLTSFAIHAHAASEPAMAPALAPSAGTEAAPKAVFSNDRRTELYRLRARCIAQANQLGLKGEASKLHVQRCITTPAPN